ncbi:hypothetical protein CgunFtcFv8_013509 [Champsocephalus gunnari]|uniref:Uncharacterized protein n=1 Tax=Champsocephalus gunnari TaxID=52237 RepID=A0AAN8HU44_CHAGU|nr:hypothetical protein CgunFtcFv8_013509 [Champsocephalus gunnari]
MDAPLPHTRGVRDSVARLCGCGLKISGTDTHQVCSSCLGLEHARGAIDNPGSCGHCVRFTVKSLQRRLGLACWNRPARDAPTGAVLSRKVVTTDACQTG